MTTHAMQHITQHLDGIVMLPELRQLLLRMLEHEELDYSHAKIIPKLQAIIVGTADANQDLALAWNLLTVFASRVDQLQDNDPEPNELLETLPVAIQWHLLITLYVLVTNILSSLLETYPAPRVARLQKFWSETVLRKSSGQLRDLLAMNGMYNDITLEKYQETVQCKTGSSFALAFGSVAILSSDDENFICTLINIGEIMGTLLQYSDDFGDYQSQSDHPLTLPNILKQAFPETDIEQASGNIWHLLYTEYAVRLDAEAKKLPDEVEDRVRVLFTSMFS